MYLAYTDESGDSGYINSPTEYFVLNCILVHELSWQSTLENLIEMRRELKKQYGIPVRAELKSEYFIYNRGPFKELGLNRKERIGIFQSLLDFEAKTLDIKTFAVAIAKTKIKKAANDPRAIAWQYPMQRLDTFCRKQDLPERVILLPDEGHGRLVSRIMRKARRFQIIKGLYGGQLDIQARYLVEDPLDKKSDQSYFIQLADWNAYVAHRYKKIAPNNKTPDDLWEHLDSVLLREVNKEVGGPPGIVVWPRT